jgi:Xaa-Pro aminopeptidase
MISHEKATLINSKLGSIQSKLVYPPQNLVDLTWKAKPVKPDAAIYIQSTEFAGVFFIYLLFLFLYIFVNFFSTCGF